MSDPATGPEPIRIDVVSDVVCPWCYVGRRRLQVALAAWDGPAVSVHWRPYQLDPTIPEGGYDRRQYMEAKFGNSDRLAEVHQRLTAVGAEVDIPFAFAAIPRSPNTLDAHRLIRWAGVMGVQDAMVEALFRAFFVEARDIGDRVVLAEIAGAVGLPAHEVAAALDTDADIAAVQDEIAVAGQLGIRGVPFFIMAGKVGVSGAEASETLIDALRQAIAA